VLLHAVLLGSDSGLIWVQLMYLATAATVFFLAFYRVLDRAIAI
jgi:hypothetical protein